ncbi:sugar porter family MFS transporter [Corynebacterium sp. CCUG 51687]|uniref:sugar porter family MFS transporter n=1 Tax=Corynebacterium sp. CCUG 51687 TaxID=2823897 RepID=UPI002108FDA8|nr:sugar porter family MFS transporter [Corynebacterium sp. CCUG 51687]MCQ4613123.1 sugar porter family MFS transporter [Corynebacterium sp. CCUG 51687]
MQQLTTAQRSYVRKVAGVAALGGLLFGYDTGVMSGALLYITPEFQLTPGQEGLVTSMLLVGAAVGALSGGAIADRLGRKRTLIMGGLVFIAGSLWCALAGSVEALAAARTFLGVGVGGVSIVAPMYISEMVPARVRGKMVSLNTLMIVVGQLLAYSVNSVLASTGSWQLMLGLAAVPGAALAVGMAFLPETPLWLARHQRIDAALTIGDRVGMTREELTLETTEDAELRAQRGGEWARLRNVRWLRMTVLIAALLGITQQVTGVNAIVYFAPTMMNKVGLSTENAVYTSMVIGLVSVVACWVGLQVIDRIGRKRLLLIGLSGNVIFLFALTLTYRAAENNAALAWVSLACMALFIASQQAAVSPTTWLLISELVPPQIRGAGMGLAGLALWVMNWIVAQFFLPLVDALSATATFSIFIICGILAAGFVRYFVPETMNRSLDEVASEMEQRYTK